MVGGASAPSGPPPVVALVGDLMDRSRVEIASRDAGMPVTFVSEAADLVDAVTRGARLVVIDLAHPGALDVLPLLGAVHTVGYASHVDKDLIDEARRAGCDEVLPRSAVFRRLARAAEET